MGISPKWKTLAASAASALPTLKASTKWMKNFTEDNAYYQKIKLIQQVENKDNTTALEQDFYEFKLLV